MLVDYFNGCASAHNLGIAAQIKIIGESLLVFTSPWFVIYVLAIIQQSTKLYYLGRRKGFKTSKIWYYL
jgi:hypothetical protein